MTLHTPKDAALPQPSFRLFLTHTRPHTYGEKATTIIIYNKKNNNFTRKHIERERRVGVFIYTLQHSKCKTHFL